MEFVAGCIGGCAGIVIGYPFDTVKVRLQAQHPANCKYHGPWHCFKKTVKTESFRGLFKGMSSPIAGASLINGIVFCVHGNVNILFEDPYSLRSQAISGAAAGFAQSFITSPLELAKIRMQLQSNSKTKDYVRSYKNPLLCLLNILNSEGPKGCLRGQTITIIREVPAFVTYFTSYQYLLKVFSDDHKNPGRVAILMAGGIAGSLSWAFTYPVDVIKSRIQADGINRSKYKGIWHCMKLSVANEGIAVMSRGLSTSVIRAFPANAATFTVFTWIMSSVEKYQRK